MPNPAMVVPTPIKDLILKPALLGHEDPKLYLRLLEQLWAALQPKNVLEWIWLKDIVDYTWETLRLRGLKGSLFALQARRATNATLRRVLPPNTLADNEIERISTSWSFDPQTKELADAILQQHGHSLNSVLAQSYMQCAGSLEQMDAMMGKAAQRRDQAVRELQRSREEVILPSNAPRVIDVNAAAALEAKSAAPIDKVS